mgnify:CR=1 FL=1
MAKKRTHILLEPEQQKVLADIAKREGCSISEATREIVAHGIEQREVKYATEKNRLQALEKIRQVRMAILNDRGGKQLPHDSAALTEELREARHDQIINRSG